MAIIISTIRMAVSMVFKFAGVWLFDWAGAVVGVATSVGIVVGFCGGFVGFWLGVGVGVEVGMPFCMAGACASGELRTGSVLTLPRLKSYSWS